MLTTSQDHGQDFAGALTSGAHRRHASGWLVILLLLDQRPGDALGAVFQTPGCPWHQRPLAVERPRRAHFKAKAHERRKLFAGTLGTCKHACQKACKPVFCGVNHAGLQCKKMVYMPMS